ncbi:hypothetical protein KHC23_13070 [Ancylobacter dichloromethanicus]|uniref:Uncharacterized protein n=1 Tax=Ancylobacter dichloromethanicus TaxID=518825 RepID=A0A9W6J6G2_9HYPH|nr:hypothetical protein [Ancylobacter dichloromethanicus]MBS7554585.1 hypothetical protein [Ancylobacter dichloromethanicus]GLK71715.1 hypothetical protein GCM10017643_18300 [Ancylobacter dichloromethanicus]
MMYLPFPTEAGAMARSRAALLAAYPNMSPDSANQYLWSWRVHPGDGRGAIEIPATPEEAGLGLAQDAYDGLLTGAERTALVPEISADWTPELT